VRQAAVEEIYRGLSDSLRDHPWATSTLDAIQTELEARGIHVSVETIRRDLKALGTENLKAERKHPWYVWPKTCPPHNDG
jgi:hypothetical protein